MRPALLASFLVSSGLVSSTAALALGGALPAESQGPSLVATAALEKLLPAPAGWMRTRTNQNRIALSDTSAYTYADAVYTNGATRLRVTLADTASDPASLAVVATLVTSFPADYSGQIPPATTIKRLTLNDAQAAVRWDSAAKDGEFIVVVNNRFVAKAEATGIESSDVLQKIIEGVDLKALAALR
jgi:hypothetical protein